MTDQIEQTTPREQADPARANWMRVAAAWERHADFIDQKAAEVTATLLERAAVGAGDRVLDLACGPGGAGLAAAAVVGDEGCVVLSDLAPEMTAIAAARAAERGLNNVITRVLDLDRIDGPDQEFDVVVCREGVNFATDPAVALAGMRRVLRPGGHLALAVWGPPAANPWLTLVFKAVAPYLDGPRHGGPSGPGPFGLTDPARLHHLLVAAGFHDVVVDEHSTPSRDASFEDWWTRTSELAGPVAQLLGSLGVTDRRALMDDIRTAVEPFETPEGLVFPGLSLVGSGRASG